MRKRTGIRMSEGRVFFGSARWSIVLLHNHSDRSLIVIRSFCSG